MVNKRAAGLIVFRRILTNIEFLMMRASYGDYNWTPPKGHVDPGETDMQTALRETFEEAGLKESDLQITDFKKELHYVAWGKPKDVIYWAAELKTDTPVKLSKEHTTFEWAALDQACKLAGYEDLQNLLRECHAHLTKP